MKSQPKIIAQGELADGWGTWEVRVTRLNLFQAIVHWWKCKFGEYKNHYSVVTDKDGNKIEGHPLNSGNEPRLTSKHDGTRLPLNPNP